MMKRTIQARAAWCAALATVPVLAVTTVALIVAPPGDWPELRPAQWMTIAANTLILEAALALAAATVAGVAAGMSWRLVSGTAIFVAASAMVTLVLTGYSVEAVRWVAAPHVVLGAAVMACATLGAAAKALFPNDLDAAACSLAAAEVAGFAVFVMGPAAIDLPAAVLNLALVASPVVAVAAAADIDLFRGELLYHLSPIAHRQFDYPSWYSAASLYFVVATAAMGAAACANWRHPGRRFNNLTGRG